MASQWNQELFPHYFILQNCLSDFFNILRPSGPCTENMAKEGFFVFFFSVKGEGASPNLSNGKSLTPKPLPWETGGRPYMGMWKQKEYWIFLCSVKYRKIAYVILDVNVVTNFRKNYIVNILFFAPIDIYKGPIYDIR